MKILSFGHIPIAYGGRQTSGAAYVIYYLAKAMSERYEVSCVLAATDIFREEYNDCNLRIRGWTKSLLISYILKNLPVAIRIFSLSLLNSLKYKQNFISVFFKSIHLQRCLDLEKPDILHLHNHDSLLYIKTICNNGVKIALTKHSMNGFNKDEHNYSLLRRIEQEETRSKLDYMIFVSEVLKKKWIENYGVPMARKVTSVRNAINNEIFRFTDHVAFNTNKIKLITIASVSENKGQKRVLQALVNLQDRRFEYEIVGSCLEETQNEFIEIATKNGIKLTMLGKLSPEEVAVRLRMSNFMILPSTYEGFGLVYIESIACGTPVILPKHLPIAEEHDLLNINNTIYLEDNSVASIESSLKEILARKDVFDYKKVAESIYELGWDNAASKYIKLFS